MKNDLPFEKALSELHNKIEELRHFSREKNINFFEEIAYLEERYRKLKDEIYNNLTASQKMQIARHVQRFTTLDYIQCMFTQFFEMHGDRLFGDDLAIVGGIAKLNGTPVTVIGHQKGRTTKENLSRNFGMPHPEGFRKALRLMQQANKFNRPIITFIDTPGAFPGEAAEERGQSEAIARNLYEMSKLEVPVICIVIGEGGSGGALALGVGNRVLMMEHAIYSVASPNAAAAILWKDAAKADKAAEAMKITAQDLLELGIIDSIIPEPANCGIEVQAALIKNEVLRHLRALQGMDKRQLRENRYEKFRQMGKYTFENHEPNENVDMLEEINPKILVNV
ncbi:acetyl-CoA carboxylase carboxyl transferase subunit alpha [Paenibacillus filicis]|uniref:Acetyl-coenzyme A carboxylase carboxyl transferase subunit alpha n=1 Tax=Paenibacillus gyeongsangnamensis TaxID=3388067 RepID=A0ABT4Q8E7_9BACL|nr:acetyl-CoA carboxylase carboxyl transferase subunit alpha [Paenibacillus filicis]MCZ8513147.1 acetyl-CoA carboxylase carboxyl transferase subunit alpha [Paenibacillus filicis]